MSLLKNFQKGLAKTRQYISESLVKISAAFGSFDEKTLDDLEMTLVGADMGVANSMDIIDKVKEGIRKTGDNSREFVVNIIKSETKKILGENHPYEPETGKLNIIVLAGVNGTGKTTTAGKLAHRYISEGRKVMMAAGDTFRAAAIEQLVYWGELNNVPVISHETGGDPGAVVYDSIQAAKTKNIDVLIVDTAGRLHNKKNLMEEFAKILRIINREAPDGNTKVFLVIDATTGQNAVVQAQTFKEVAPLDGIILTKLDSNSKGGVVVAVKKEVDIPVVLAGLGEGVEDLTDFETDSFVDALFE